MKTTFIFLTLLILISILFIIPSSHSYINNLLSYSPCDTPITYKIGNVDSRFNLNAQEVQSDVIQASSLWSEAENKELFIYSPQGYLTISFIYDQRQLLDTQIQQLQSQLNSNNSNLQAQIQAYYKQAADFRNKLDTLNQQIASWNEKGGAPPDIYHQLIQQQKDLRTEADQLNTEAKSLNISTETYNTQVQVLNHDVSQFNSALSQKPEEGLFDPNNETVTIYFASNQSELIHTLAHELGHSLGLQHESDQNAIMYPYTTKTTSLTNADINQLQYVCRKQSAFILWRDSLQQFIRTEILTRLHTS